MEKTFRALVLKRSSIVHSFTMGLKNKVTAFWIDIKAIHRSSAYGKIQRKGYVIVLLFEEGSEKEESLKKGTFKNFKTNHQKDNAQNQ